MDKHQRSIELLKKVETFLEDFEQEKYTMLKAMQEKQATKEGWAIYRDCQKFYTNARRELNSAYNICLDAVKRPTSGKIKNIEGHLQLFDETWQYARQYSMMGLLRK
jgi:hypothetical protein